jgi:hypothetical protein
MDQAAEQVTQQVEQLTANMDDLRKQVCLHSSDNGQHACWLAGWLACGRCTCALSVFVPVTETDRNSQQPWSPLLFVCIC